MWVVARQQPQRELEHRSSCGQARELAAQLVNLSLQRIQSSWEIRFVVCAADLSGHRRPVTELLLQPPDSYERPDSDDGDGQAEKRKWKEQSVVHKLSSEEFGTDSHYSIGRVVEQEKEDLFRSQPDCGFLFRDRTKLTRPGRCPKCRGEGITAPYTALSRYSPQEQDSAASHISHWHPAPLI
jgi:predicted Zn-ribbon and HTH transcriptional regulator